MDKRCRWTPRCSLHVTWLGSGERQRNVDNSTASASAALQLALGVAEAKGSSLICLESTWVYLMRAQVKHAREFGQSLSLLKAKAGMASGHCVHAWDSFSSGNCRRQDSECCATPPPKCGVTGAMNSTISPIAQQYTTSDCGYPANIFSWLKWWNLVQYKHIKVLQRIPWAWEMCFCRVWPD